MFSVINMQKVYCCHFNCFLLPHLLLGDINCMNEEIKQFCIYFRLFEPFVSSSHALRLSIIYQYFMCRVYMACLVVSYTFTVRCTLPVFLFVETFVAIISFQNCEVNLCLHINPPKVSNIYIYIYIYIYIAELTCLFQCGDGQASLICRLATRLEIRPQPQNDTNRRRDLIS